jgi:hypothetical protein
MTLHARASAKSRLPFQIAVSLIAAAIGDALVETTSNTGALGPGYADNDHLSVIPALIAGASLTLLVVFGRCLRLFRNPARRVSHRSPLADVPCVLLVQFLALFIMESCEQLCFGGRLLGGTVWLGGPVWFSVLTHVILGTSFALLLGRATGAIVRRCEALVQIALEFMLDAFDRDRGIFASRRYRFRPCGNQVFCVHLTGERAPPLLVAFS